MRSVDGARTAELLDPDRAIAAVRAGFLALHRGTVAMPTRLQLPAGSGTLLCMPATCAALGAGVVKVVSVHPDNPARGLPTILGVVVLVDGHTGEVRMACDAAALTAIRTGAASGVATDVLARRDAEVLTIIGAGAQAPHQVRAVAAVRPLREVRIVNRTRARAEQLAARLATELPEVRVAVWEEVAAAVATSDIVCTATSSPTPVLPADAVPPGCHLNAIGSFRPDMRELPRELLARARVVVDAIDAALSEAGEIIDALDAGVLRREDLVELGAVLAGDAAGRTTDDEITVFDSCGLAVQDLYAAAALWERLRDGPA